jgi:hypothetical protein
MQHRHTIYRWLCHSAAATRFQNTWTTRNKPHFAPSRVAGLGARFVEYSTVHRQVYSITPLRLRQLEHGTSGRHRVWLHSVGMVFFQECGTTRTLRLQSRSLARSHLGSIRELFESRTTGLRASWDTGSLSLQNCMI